MVDVFKTNVTVAVQAMKLVSRIRQEFPDLQVNFDLGDCDKILRIEGIAIPKDKITKALVSQGYLCEALK